MSGPTSVRLAAGSRDARSFLTGSSTIGGRSFLTGSSTTGSRGRTDNLDP